MTIGAPVVFVDLETTGLDPVIHQIWEVGLITPDGHERQWFLDVDLGRADPKALEIGRFHQRHPRGYDRRSGGRTSSNLTVARTVASVTRGLWLAGNVVSFDQERLHSFLRANGACPAWNYHLIDTEALAAGFLGVTPPWKSDELSRKLGVEPDQFDRHTAIGDCRWAKAIYRAVMEGAR